MFYGFSMNPMNPMNMMSNFQNCYQKGGDYMMQMWNSWREVASSFSSFAQKQYSRYAKFMEDSARGCDANSMQQQSQRFIGDSTSDYLQATTECFNSFKKMYEDYIRAIGICCHQPNKEACSSGGQASKK